MKFAVEHCNRFSTPSERERSHYSAGRDNLRGRRNFEVAAE